ncbi:MULTISPECIES: Arm DNA-binding domain-containing protein [unclassified Pseudovibrio]|uniref:Arm DNA-binding domain-containing protein n=1 Tax=unclassified Pseudovibrio TaxID=2627060 RepID=UPI0007AE68B8|nr:MULTISPECIES: Arm DNA-binding domain-containing protein [unclassified Pseudovibrio]KZK92454.1 hypothetical protein PsW74_05737 [Pseudovibrio sp. W74]KZL08651.1 hypothetical protein PsAD14_02972 [Pseudovibrio sp. Ad14]
MATRLTNSDLKNFKYEGKRIRLSDSVEEGLLVTVGAKTKTFSVYVKVAGQRLYETLGYFPELSVDEAREKVRKMKKTLCAKG